jgi:hypothetical protein
LTRRKFQFTTDFSACRSFSLKFRILSLSRFHPASNFAISTEVVPPKTRDLLRGLREELRALDLAIATFERLAALREEQEEDRKPKPPLRKAVRPPRYPASQ